MNNLFRQECKRKCIFDINGYQYWYKEFDNYVKYYKVKIFEKIKNAIEINENEYTNSIKEYKNLFE